MVLEEWEKAKIDKIGYNKLNTGAEEWKLNKTKE